MCLKQVGVVGVWLDSVFKASRNYNVVLAAIPKRNSFIIIDCIVEPVLNDGLLHPLAPTV